jgi:hypothetical protein
MTLRLSMSKLTRHILLPLLSTLILVALYFTPKETFGCVQRGLMAVFVVLVSAGFAFWAIFKGFRAKSCGEVDAANWWIITAILLTLPLALLLGPLR